MSSEKNLCVREITLRCMGESEVRVNVRLESRKGRMGKTVGKGDWRYDFGD